MKMHLGLAIACAACAMAQVVPGTPSFEVASIKPAAPQDMNRITVMTRGDGDRITYTNVSLMNVLTRAYGVKNYQISGPSWLDSERFDINAKMPEGAPADQVPAMLRNLLADRFKMVVRRETREQPVYALVAGKDGLKLKKSDNADDSPGFLPPLPPAPEAGGSEGKAGASGPAMRSMTVTGAPGGAGAAPPKGMMMMSSNGHVEARKTTLKAFADMLSTMLDRPVLDQTATDGEYDFTLDISPEDMAGTRKAAPALPPPAPDGALATEALPSASIFTAVQQYGLRLESHKAPVEYIVVERVEKVPTEN